MKPDPEALIAWRALTAKLLGKDAKIKITKAANGAVISVHAFVRPSVAVHAAKRTIGGWGWRTDCGTTIPIGEADRVLELRPHELEREGVKLTCKTCLAIRTGRRARRAARESP